VGLGVWRLGSRCIATFAKMPWASPATYGPIAPVMVTSLNHAFGYGARAVLEAGRVMTIFFNSGS